MTGAPGTVDHSLAFNDAVCCKINGDDGTVHETETFPLAGAICKIGVSGDEPM